MLLQELRDILETHYAMGDGQLPILIRSAGKFHNVFEVNVREDDSGKKTAFVLIANPLPVKNEDQEQE